MTHTQVVTEFIPDRVSTHDCAQGVGAHAHGVVTVGVALVLGIESGHSRNLGRGQVQLLSTKCDAVFGDVTVYGLHQVQHRQQRGALLWVAPNNLGCIYF